MLTSLSTVSKKAIPPFVSKFSRETNVERRYDLLGIKLRKHELPKNNFKSLKGNR